MFDQLDCIKVRIDFAIIENQSEMDFFLVLICANKLSFSLRLFLFLRISLGFFCQCAIAIVHLLIFSAVLILFILKPIEMDIRSLFRTCKVKDESKDVTQFKFQLFCIPRLMICYYIFLKLYKMTPINWIFCNKIQLLFF